MPSLNKMERLALFSHGAGRQPGSHHQREGVPARYPSCEDSMETLKPFFFTMFWGKKGMGMKKPRAVRLSRQGSLQYVSFLIVPQKEHEAMIRDALVTMGIAAANGGGCAGFSSQTRGPSPFLARVELHVHTPGRGGSWRVAPYPQQQQDARVAPAHTCSIRESPQHFKV